MEICVIHGSNRKGNTEKTIEIIKNKLNSFEEIVYSDIYLPKDLPHFCCGCFACLGTGDYAGENCPHKHYTHSIIKKMLNSDGIIIASPCYALSETGQLKTLFDHFACTYLCHRPNDEMFDKIGFVISTAAGAGTKNVIRSVKRNLLFWGIKRTIK
jgi:multimeric flavodoxin WrbA